MKKSKKIIHKIKWQVIEGFFVRRFNISETRSLCNNMGIHSYVGGNASVRWKNVTCKNCLKMRK